MKAVLWTLGSVLVGVLLLYVPLYSEQKAVERGRLNEQVLAAKWDTAKARRLDRWNASVARRWSVMASPREDSERRISAILEEGKDR